MQKYLYTLMALWAVEVVGFPAKQRQPFKHGWQKQLSVTQSGETPNQKTDSITQQGLHSTEGPIAEMHKREPQYINA